MAEVFTKPSRRIQNMIAKELRLIVKDRVALFLIFLLPAVSIGMLYYVTQETIYREWEGVIWERLKTQNNLQEVQSSV